MRKKLTNGIRSKRSFWNGRKAKNEFKKMKIRHLMRNGAVTKWSGSMQARSWAKKRKRPRKTNTYVRHR